jgi:hypothetical protein
MDDAKLKCILFDVIKNVADVWPQPERVGCNSLELDPDLRHKNFRISSCCNVSFELSKDVDLFDQECEICRDLILVKAWTTKCCSCNNWCNGTTACLYCKASMCTECPLVGERKCLLCEEAGPAVTEPITREGVANPYKFFKVSPSMSKDPFWTQTLKNWATPKEATSTPKAAPSTHESALHTVYCIYYRISLFKVKQYTSNQHGGASPLWIEAPRPSGLRHLVGYCYFLCSN